MLKIRLFFLVVLVLSLSSCNQKNCSTNFLNQSLHFSALAQTWDEAVPLGNGELGALVWQKENKLRFSLDRSDLWDLRPIESFRKEGFSYEWVTGQVKNRDYKPVQDLFDVPYNQLPAPSKIPGAALEFDMHMFGNVEKVELDIANAICNVEWKSGVKMLTFVCADMPVGWFRFENIPEGFTPDLVPPVYEKSDTGQVENALSGQDLQRLGYKQGRVKTNENSVIYRQKGWGNFEYEVAVAWKYQTGNALIGCWSVSSTFSENETGKNAGQMISEMLNNGFSKYFVMHQNWWTDFWRKSSIEIPDSVLQLQWYLEQYKFGSAARHNTPPISLQAVWTADNGKLPPWKGDFHHDLNTQLSYWPAYSGNHLDLELGFINWLWNNRETFKDYTRNYFNTEGLNVPGVTTLDGKPMGGWIQYSFGPTVGAWLGHHFYLHWKYSNDSVFLAQKAYPWMKDVAIYLEQISEFDENGKRKLPISSSPEINNNRIDAWFTKNTNFDLALIRFTFEKTAEMARSLGKTEEAERWLTILNEWPDFARAGKNNGLAIAPDYPLTESHRHFSHLMAWHPLGIIDWSNGSTDQEIIQATLKDLQENGTDLWVGYSFSWLGNLYARAFDGDKAAETLRIFAENFCLPNSFHVNGEQHNRGYSNFKYRPFTLEGNFAFAAAIQEMLIQSHTGTVKLLPAVPKNWKNIQFKGLRAEGAFVFDLKMINGIISEITILPDKGGILFLHNPFFPEKFDITGGKLIQDGELLEIETTSGTYIALKPN